MFRIIPRSTCQCQRFTRNIRHQSTVTTVTTVTTTTGTSSTDIASPATSSTTTYSDLDISKRVKQILERHTKVADRSLWRKLQFTDLSLKFKARYLMFYEKVMRDCAEEFGLSLENRELNNISDVRGLIKFVSKSNEGSTSGGPVTNIFSSEDTVETLFARESSLGKLPPNVYFKK
ncbi:hypothetical protein HDU97_000452 [Phlyctochytrium planicorne]|nr:hypothetical protein HDU97_000452 [Phlyctochytrium planicorne]